MATVLVTGANKGIGFEVCKFLLHEGYHVVFSCRDKAKAKKSMATLGKAKHGGKLSGPVILDLNDPASIAHAVEQVQKEFKTIDVLVNNAGAGLWSPAEMSYERAKETMQVNFFGTMDFTEAMLPLVKTSIINLASNEGRLKQVSTDLQKRFKVADTAQVRELAEEYLEHVKKGDFAKKGWPKSGDMYGPAKLCLVAYSRDLAKRTAGTPAVMWVHPGYCQTDLTIGRGDRTAEQGADVINWLATMDEAGAKEHHGKFYFDRKEFKW